MKKETIISKLAERKKDLEDRFHITRIGLFGSYSRNTQNENSDLDLVYELSENTSLGLKEIDEFENYIKKIFNIKKIDLVNQKYMNPIIAEEMKKSVIYV